MKNIKTVKFSYFDWTLESFKNFWKIFCTKLWLAAWTGYLNLTMCKEFNDVIRFDLKKLNNFLSQRI